MINVLLVSENQITTTGFAYSVFWEKHGYTIIERINSLQQGVDMVKNNNITLAFVELPIEHINFSNASTELSIFECKLVIVSHDKNIKNESFTNNKIIDGIYIPDFDNNDLIARLNRYNDTVFKKMQPISYEVYDDYEIIKVARYQFLEHLIYGRYNDDKTYLQKLKRVGIVFPYNRFAVFVVKLKAHNDKSDLQSLAHAFSRKFIQECIYVFPNEFDELVFIWNYYDDLSGDFFTVFLDTLQKKVVDLLYDNYDVEFTIYSCNSCKTFNTIPNAYLECCNKMKPNNDKLLIDDESNEKDNIYIKKIMNYIHTNYASQINLKDLADTVGFTPSYFSSFFKTQQGITYSAYLSEYRLKKACNLLTTTTHHINEIAQLVGYKNENYFSKLFKSKIGTSPSEYRKKPSDYNLPF